MEQKTAFGILAVGMILSAWILGAQMKNLRAPGVITVKGVAEESYQADWARWSIGVSGRYANYAQALKGVENQLPVIEKFLKEQGFEPSEYRVGTPSISEHYEDIRRDDRWETVQNGYDATQNFVIESTALDKIARAHSNALQLRAKNEVIVFGNPEYLLSNLETVKRSLIAKATEDAYARAQEFARSGRGSVKAMRSASQGSFNIFSDGPSDENSDYGGSYDTTTIGKRVRLVVTVSYGVD